MSEKFCCQACGGNLVQIGDIYECQYCHRQYNDIVIERAYKKLENSLKEKFGDLVHEEIVKNEQEKFRPLLSQLWQKSQEKYTDSKAILQICKQIKEIYPDNFIANFYEVANSGSVSQINEFLNGVDVIENSCFVEDIVNFLLKSLEMGNVASLNYLVEKAYKNTDMELFERFSTLIETEAQKVDAGAYNTDIPRDVFVAYSSKDLPEVLKLVEAIESQGVTCFIAMRNLRHGRGAKANYETELKKAMDNASMVVFVSSKNSRRMDCDALKIELPYIKRKDIENIPTGYKNDYTDSRVLGYKKPRIEYRIDNEPTPFADRVLKEFFAGLEYAKSLEDTLDRIASILTDGFGEKNLASDINIQVEEKIRELEERLKETEKSEKPTKERLTTLKKCKIGDYIKFGKYEQDNNKYNGQEEIEWLVLDKVDDKALVISKYALDSEPFNNKSARESDRYAWSWSPIRSWLNNTFYSSAFNDSEKSIIASTKITPKDLGYIRSDLLGAETSDKVFLLDVDGVNNYFKDDEARQAEPTLYAKTNGCHSPFGNCSWWLNSVGRNSIFYVNRDGEVIDYAGRPDSATIGVRPAMWIRCDEESCRKIEIEVQRGVLVKYKGTETNLIIPEGITDIGKQAFFKCESLVGVIIPDSVVSIGEEAFRYCNGLRNITIPESVTGIGKNAFANCDNLAIFYDGAEIRQGFLQNWNGTCPVAINEEKRLAKERRIAEEKSRRVREEQEKLRIIKEIEMAREERQQTAKKKAFIERYGQDVYDKFGVFEKGSILKFGQYEQDNDMQNGKEDIEWIVLDVVDGKALLISRYVLDFRVFDQGRSGLFGWRANSTWAKCSLRNWLNDSFFNEAFSAEEKLRVPTVKVKADENVLNRLVYTGMDTQDKVFLLSMEEAKKYLTVNIAKCPYTKYARAQTKNKKGLDENCCWWWLRTPGAGKDCGSFINCDGQLRNGGAIPTGFGEFLWVGKVYNDCFGVRPALWINLK